MYSYMCFLVTF